MRLCSQKENSMSRYVPGPRNKPSKKDARGREPSPPIEAALLIRLREQIGLLPPNFHIELPRIEGLRLVRRGLATVVGSLDMAPDLVLDEDDVRHAIYGETA